ncbi:MAG: glycosyltransferase family 2 protein [Pseudomonadales bacterium]
MTNPPKVSIGVPIFNGANYLQEALDSLLAQTYEDFEILICDNASTDSTGDICKKYVAQDHRISYHRNEQNIGPDLNFTRIVDLARGEYFKWAAHDDLLEPTFLQKCVAALDADPEVVLCHSLTRIIDHQNRELSTYDSGLQAAASNRQSRRFAALILHQHICSDMFGLIRIDALRQSKRLEGNYHGCDRAMLAELSLIGRFAQLPEALFLNREHRARSVRSIKSGERCSEPRQKARAKIPMNTLRLYRDYWQAVLKHADSGIEKAVCMMYLLPWWFVSWNALRVGTELIAQIYPNFYDIAKRMKNRYVQPAHPLYRASAEAEK